MKAQLIFFGSANELRQQAPAPATKNLSSYVLIAVVHLTLSRSVFLYM